MKIVSIIQARVNSIRFPGKVMKEIMGKSMLQLQIKRIKRCKLINQIVIATTTNPDDYKIEKLAKKLKVTCFRGSEKDVLDRYYQAAKKYRATIIVRITGDNPVIDPKIICQLIKLFQTNKVDYVSNTRVQSFPIGMNAEVFSINALTSAWRGAKSAYDREHVTSFIYNPKSNFKLKDLIAKKSVRRPDLRLTVDKQADFKLVKAIYTKLYPLKPNFATKDIIDLLDQNPRLNKINQDVKQKPAKYKRKL